MPDGLGNVGLLLAASRGDERVRAAVFCITLMGAFATMGPTVSEKNNRTGKTLTIDTVFSKIFRFHKNIAT